MNRILLTSNTTKLGSVFYLILTHFSTCGRVGPQVFSSQDVAVNYILHKGEIHQIGSITEAKKDRNLIKNNNTEDLKKPPRINNLP